ncbi:cache domain-containing protein [Arcobacter aquimarinus]|uniref:histidine kinase n=1 Tax=Arcobacter aquimarinus TaxID=1315211 RepID=A0AAE7B698_9BACT|nr:cache domain-containing protein [Arcobacter aquimarinus]QKE26642.1 Cache sensor-containing signal transduction histidine kinase [Arcobacter aquimarinus]
MIYKNENQLINIIKFTPPVFIITISIVITFFLYLDKQNELEKEKFFIKNEFIKNNKETAKQEVENLYNFISNYQEKTEEKLKENIKNRVYEAHSIATRIYNENKNLKSKDEIKKMIKDALVDIRFNNGSGYFFIYSFDYECILLPINRKLEGTSFYNFKEGKGKYLTRNIITQLKNEKEGFLSWWFNKPDDLENQYKKIGFNMLFEPYNWFIGTGEYFVDFEEIIKKEVLDYISKLNKDKNNYFFIIDYNKNTLLHLIPDLVNKPAIDVTNIENQKIFDEMIEIAKQGEGFLTYNHKPINSDSFSTKTSYIKGINNWQWAIGKGFYQDDVNTIINNNTLILNDKFHKKVINLISIALILTSLLLIISIYVSKILEKKFINYKKEINKYIEENSKQQHILSQQSKMAAMGEMIGNIAHQWRQPLSVITTVASGMKLQKEFNTLDDKTFNESIDNITNSAQYLSKTIDDFRNFFRTDKNESIFSINECLYKVIKLTDAQFKNNEIIFIKNLKDFNILGLENEFIQALINILNNAKDALLEKDGLRIIIISTYEENHKAFIKIEDNAGGIDEKIIDKIFEPYFTTKHQSKGTGIGLYMTQKIITKHMNGTIEIKNSEITYQEITYKGTKVSIELPINL